MRAALTSLLFCLALALAGCGGGGSPTSPSPQHSEPKVRVPSGPPPKTLVVKDLIEGSGEPAEPGDELTVEYVGIHYNGEPFTNSWERSKPFKFRLGSNSYFVNPGWEKGLKGMRVGGRRELIVPPAFLYQGGALPGSKPEDTLVYVIDLVAVN